MTFKALLAVFCLLFVLTHAEYNVKPKLPFQKRSLLEDGGELIDVFYALIDRRSSLTMNEIQSNIAAEAPYLTITIVSSRKLKLVLTDSSKDPNAVLAFIQDQPGISYVQFKHIPKPLVSSSEESAPESSEESVSEESSEESSDEPSSELVPSSEVAEESSSSSSSEEESSSSLEESSSSEEQESSTSEESEEPSSVFEPIFDHSQFVKKTEVKALLDEMLKSSLPEIVRMVKESLVSQESSDESSESEASEPTESIIKSSAEPEAPAVPPSNNSTSEASELPSDSKEASSD
eukprot:TRINITY_DN19639_c0_g1_i1.p1 TRINITY_DN19639_c0_g1~~TRINITY_DN19639_c0_g1_i1.p1  ORF type:complete len:292 (-),score=58.50 TRINITY_DN19639_c0_g1_i1:3-878(-)